MARLGLLCHHCPEGSTSADFPPNSVPGALLDELGTLGWVEGKTLTLEWRGAAGVEERLAGLAAELVALEPDLLYSLVGTPPALALQRAGGSTPMVFFSVGDPGGPGWSRASPTRGRLTGTANFSPELAAKRLQLLQEAVPGSAGSTSSGTWATRYRAGVDRDAAGGRAARDHPPSVRRP